MTHCHFTYRHGAYTSPWFWPTHELAEEASLTFVPYACVTEEPEVFAVHGANCACTPIEEGVPA